MGLPEHVGQHIATMARLHRDDRYDRATDDVEDHRRTAPKPWSSTWRRIAICV